MPRYSITYPVVGSVTVYDVDADSEEEAIEKGRDLVDHKDAELQWEAVRQIVQGNIFYGETNNISVYKEDDDE